MADAAVIFLLEKLRQLLLYNGHLIRDSRSDVERLETDLRLFKSFLKDTMTKRRNDERLRELVREIRDAVYEVDDYIDAFLAAQAAETTKSRSYLFPRPFRRKIKRLSIPKDVRHVASKVMDIFGDRGMYDFANLHDQEPAENKPSIVRQYNVVGFEDVAADLLSILREETDQLDVISIVGMPGLGKTTVAGKVFHDQEIQYEFPTRIWVHISQDFRRKNVFLEILREFTSLTNDLKEKTDQELARMVEAHLEVGRFLIVMDDVWTTEDLDKLRIALPRNTRMGKVLITSRNQVVASHANRSRDPYELRFLTPYESWMLLQYEVFGKSECPPELADYGKIIAKQCDGLPLAIVLIAEILMKKSSARNDMIAQKYAFRKVSESLSMYLTHEDPRKRIENTIALSYDNMPYHLRACFLYLGMFPEDIEIPVWKLTRIWIAEGFIQEESGLSMEETAENYLDDLIKRNLVRASKMKRDGNVKTCRIKGVIRDFCQSEAGNESEGFLQEIIRSTNGDFNPPVRDIQNCRRLCIHSNVLSFFSLKPHCPRVRSFVCFSEEEINLPPESISIIPATFKLLRVLEANPVTFTKIPNNIYQLVHLRYITISFNLAILPQAFSQLWNLQTIVVDTPSRTLEIRVDIWKMIHLRHLKTNASSILPEIGEGGKEGEKLQTLGTIAPQSCTEKVFGSARHVKKLGIRGRLTSLLAGRSTSFDSMGKLDNLENLKLLNDVFPSPPSEGKLHGLPSPYQFPPKLRSLTLSATFLDWQHMSVLGFLENLEILKLKDKAFMGKIWNPVDGGFRRLEILHIGRTDLVIWTASGHQFPRLRRLELRNCEGLMEVPIGLADIPTFRMLDLHCTSLAVASAKTIQEEKQKMQEKRTAKVDRFKLTIFPPVE